MTNRVDRAFAAGEETITRFEAEFVQAEQHGCLRIEILPRNAPCNATPTSPDAPLASSVPKWHVAVRSRVEAPQW